MHCLQHVGVVPVRTRQPLPAQLKKSCHVLVARAVPVLAKLFRGYYSRGTGFDLVPDLQGWLLLSRGNGQPLPGLPKQHVLSRWQ